MCPDNAAPGNPTAARCVCGGGKGKVVEQQTGALGNPCFPFSSSFSSLCVRRRFDMIFTLGAAVHVESQELVFVHKYEYILVFFFIIPEAFIGFTIFCMLYSPDTAKTLYLKLETIIPRNKTAK
jgi:hypothetical protein